MNKLLIRNARLVNEGREFEGDLRVTGDRIDIDFAGSSPQLPPARARRCMTPPVAGCCPA